MEQGGKPHFLPVLALNVQAGCHPECRACFPTPVADKCVTFRLVQNPGLAPLVPPLGALDSNKLPGLGLFRELVNTCLAQPGLTTGQLLEHYRGTNDAATLEKLSMWDDIADKDIAEKTFTDSLNHMFDSMLELRQEELIARERTHGLSSEERRELWTLNQELAKK